jgi:hypothetical protein
MLARRRLDALDQLPDWCRTKSDACRPYAFVNAEQLIDDFFHEVERVLSARGVPFDSVEVIEGDRP